MNGRVIFSVFAALAIGLSSCTERGQDLEIAPKEHFVFKATIEGSDQTKTTLGEYHDDGTTRSVLWETLDSIGVSCSHWYGFDLFINRNECTSNVAVFEGETSSSNIHYALYPFSQSVEYYINGESHEYHFDLPQKQVYSPNNFSKKSFPMVGRKLSGDDRFNFKNLCGVLVVQLTGTETIESITFSSQDGEGKPIPVSGHARVNLEYGDVPSLEIFPDNPNNRPTYENVTLLCNGGGVLLDPTTPTPFYIVLPAGTYHSPELIISTASGKMMLKESDNPLTIQRSRSAKVTPMTFTETIPVNLSERGTSNSYIVSESGIYSFDASVIGNGSAGILEDANFHTTNPDITPSKVELLWEDKEGLISGLTYNSTSKSARFMTSGQEGNAVVVAKDENGTIIWSWHIWCTDKPVEHTYVNYSGSRFQVLDRNIGATRADRGIGEEWRDAAGLVYQWGRKDPFAYNKDMVASFRFSIEQSIQYPQHISHNHMWLVDGNTSAQLWGATKTIYDPCPVGYKVAPKDTWTGFTTTGQGATHPSEPRWELPWDKGVYFTYDGTNKAWYPASYCGWFHIYISENESECWASDINSYWTDGGQAYRLYIRYGGEMDVNVQPQTTLELGGARPVRCIKDENYIDAALPALTITHFTDITSNSLMVNFTTTSIGASEITEMGIVYSTEENPTLENGTKITHPNNVTGDYDVSITNLTSSTIYYIRAYGINSYGTGYSKVRKVLVPNGDGAQVLSIEGTANSYIASPLYRTFSFEALYKGNSTESIGSPATAEVIWETKNTTESVSQGDIIRDVVYDNGIISFNLSDEGKEGNAIIAAKDGEGNILWSWHIWVTDFDAEETACTYPSGAVMMDRNLGALNNSTDVLSFGLLYQWGRKDPFVGSGDGTNTFASTYPADAISFVNTSDNRNNLSYATAHPNHNIMGSTWNYTNQGTTWWGAEKTIYDPCPPGWQIPPLSAWDNYSHGTFTYPLTGGLNEGTSYLGNVNDYSIVWSYTIQDYEWIRTFRTHSGHWQTESGGAADVSCGRSVRCQKIQ